MNGTEVEPNISPLSTSGNVTSVQIGQTLPLDKPREWQNPDYPDSRIEAMTDEEVIQILKDLKRWNKIEESGTPEQRRNSVSLAVISKAAYERYVNEQGLPAAPGATVHTVTPTTVDTPGEYSDVVPSKEVADLLIQAKRHKNPDAISFYQDLYDRQEKGEVVRRSDLESFGYETLSKAFEEEENKRAAAQAEEDRQGSLCAVCREFEKTDLGNTDRFVRRYRKNARYCHAFKQWYIWDSTRWEPDGSGKVLELAKKTVLSIYQEACITDGNASQQDLFKWFAASQSRARIDALVALAQSALPVIPDEMDSNPNLLNFPNGTLDLIPYKFRDHDREDICTKVTGAIYDPDAKCPKWKEFLHKILGGKDDLIEFLQRAAGYSLTADTGERAIFLCYGAGANGKSTFLNTIGASLGDYAMQTESSTFNVSKNEQVRNDLARLKGARYVTAIEAGKGKRLDESLVKQLSGGDRIAARFLFKEYFEFKPEFKIWWAFNHKPVINDTTQSIWDRVKLIPFTITIPPEDRDKDLSGKLLKELPGILNWCIEGLKEYRRIGLAEPAEVTAATAEYREEQDRLGDFFGERCTFEPSGFVSTSDLFYEYQKWCTDNREEPISKRAFGLEMNDRPVKREQHHKTKQKGYRGISIATSVTFRMG